MKNGYYLATEHFLTLPQSEIQIFSQFYSTKSISKRVLLLGRVNFITGSEPKIFAPWKIGYGDSYLDSVVSLLQSIQTTCNSTRCCWSSLTTNR